MAVHALDYGSQGGRVPTDMGYALVCNQCALGTDPPQFTYLHGYYLRGNNDKIRNDLRAIGANYSSRGKVLCPYCTSYDKFEVHEGFFCLWRSVQLPASRHAAAWADVDRTGWVLAESQELVAAANALRDSRRLPTMLGRGGANVAAITPSAAAPSAFSHYSGGAPAPWGAAASSAAQPADAARLAHLEAEVQRLATTVAELQQTVSDYHAWR